MVATEQNGNIEVDSQEESPDGKTEESDLPEVTVYMVDDESFHVYIEQWADCHSYDDFRLSKIIRDMIQHHFVFAKVTKWDYFVRAFQFLHNMPEEPQQEPDEFLNLMLGTGNLL